MSVEPLPTVPVVDGACSFDTASLPPECTATPATHFALAAGPASDTAVLLPFAQHRWHSRLVAALRDECAHERSARFVLVVLPEKTRAIVFHVLIEVLEHCRLNPLPQTGLPRAPTAPARAKLLPIVGTNPEPCEEFGCENTPEVMTAAAAWDIDHTVAALCQLCRVSEFVGCTVAVDVACYYIARWVLAMKSAQENPKHVSHLLQIFCNHDMGVDDVRLRESYTASTTPRSRVLSVDDDIVEMLVKAQAKACLGLVANGPIPEHFVTYLPPKAVPTNVLETRLQCFQSDEDAAVADVHCGQFPSEGFGKVKAYHYILVTDETPKPVPAVKEKPEEIAAPPVSAFAAPPKEEEPPGRLFGHPVRGDGFHRQNNQPGGFGAPATFGAAYAPAPAPVAAPAAPAAAPAAPAAAGFLAARPAGTNYATMTLVFTSPSLLDAFSTVVAAAVTLPSGIEDFQRVFESDLASKTKVLTLPPDFGDEQMPALSGSTLAAGTLDMSQTAITALPESCFAGWSELVALRLPTTLTSVGAFSFKRCTRLKKITGLHSGVAVDPWAFPVDGHRISLPGLVNAPRV